MGLVRRVECTVTEIVPLQLLLNIKLANSACFQSLATASLNGTKRQFILRTNVV